MRITTRGRYALRASLAMAKLGKDGSPVSIRQLSEQESISPVFLEQIFYKLRKAGVVDSIRGPGGGFRFSKSLDQLTLKEILDAAGEGLTLAPCSHDSSAACSNMNDCLSYQLWSEATAMVNDYFAGITIGSLIEKYRDRFDKEKSACNDK